MDCDCLSLKQTLNVDLWNGHISSWHFEPKNPEYYALIKSNMNDVLHPVPNEWSAAFIAALSNWLIQLGKISKPSNYSFVDFLNMKRDNQPLEELAVLILKLGIHYNITPSHQTIQMLKVTKKNFPIYF